jgi:D-sedoheptulose 7-phosphate isomerase
MDYKEITDNLREIIDEFFSTRTALFDKVIEIAAGSLKTGHKILVFGNGGSAAEAQHFAAELVNKFLKPRAPLRAIALTTDTSTLTSIGNDSSFDQVFSRQVEAFAEEGDVALALSTSGNSPNVILAIEAARKHKMATIALTGKGGGKIGPLADYLLDVACKKTPRIQEVHLLLLHILAQELEERLT